MDWKNFGEQIKITKIFDINRRNFYQALNSGPSLLDPHQTLKNRYFNIHLTKRSETIGASIL
jgi:hypothetical protein